MWPAVWPPPFRQKPPIGPPQLRVWPLFLLFFSALVQPIPIAGLVNCGGTADTFNSTVLWTIYTSSENSVGGVVFDDSAFPTRPRRLIFNEYTSNVYSRVLALSETGQLSWVAGPIGCVYNTSNLCTGNFGNGTLATASNVRLGNIPALALNRANGDIAFADTSTGRMRRVQYSTGLVWIVGGKGGGSTAGDGGPAWNADIPNAYALAFDPSATASSNSLSFPSTSTSVASPSSNGNHMLLVGQSLGTITSTTTSANFMLRSIVMSSSSVGWPGDIYRAAGSTTSGFAEGAALSAARFKGLHGVTIRTTDGTIYIADRGNSAIRALSAEGMVSTVAGNGSAAFGGDGLVATDPFVALRQPTDVAVDEETGTLFIADHGQSLVRKVDGTTRIITTIAGQLNNPSSSTNVVDGGGPLQSPSRAFKLWYDSTRKLLLFTDAGAKSVRAISCLRRTPAGKFYNLTANANQDCPVGSYCPEELGAMSGWGSWAVKPLACPDNAVCGAGSAQPSFFPTPSESATASPSPSEAATASPSPSFGSSPSYSSSVMASPSTSPSTSASPLFISPSPSSSVSPSTSATASPSSSPIITHPFLGCPENETIIFTLYGPGQGAIIRAETPSDAKFTGLAVDFKKRRLVFAEYAATTKYSFLKAIDEDGTVTALAGSPSVYGYGGENVPADSAAVTMTSVQDLCVDEANGDIYWAEQASYRIRKLATGEPNGLVTTVAGIGLLAPLGDGGPPTSGAVPNPMGLLCESMDGSSNNTNNNSSAVVSRLYITQAGSGGETIRVIELWNNSMTTLAGITGTQGFSQGAFLGAATFRSPYSIHPTFESPVYAPYGTVKGLVVADSNNHAVRLLSTSDQIVTALAGNGNLAPMFTGDGGPAVAAKLNRPTDVVSDANTGNLYIADNGNDAIRMVDRKGTITTVVGTPRTAAAPGNVLDYGVGSTAGLRAGPVSPFRMFFDAPRRLLLFSDSGMRGIRGVTCARDKGAIPAGYRFNLLKNDLEPCRKGFLCPADSGIIAVFNGSLVSAPIRCIAPLVGNGTYCPSGSAAPQACPAGKFCPGPLFGDAFECPEGSYCPFKTETPISCPDGFECLPGASFPTVPSPSATVTPTASATVSVTGTYNYTLAALMSPTPTPSVSRSVAASPSVTGTTTPSFTPSPKPRAPFLGCGTTGSPPQTDYSRLFLFTLYGASNASPFVSPATADPIQLLGGVAFDSGRNSTGHLVRPPRLYFSEYYLSGVGQHFSYVRAIDAATGALSIASGGTTGVGYFGSDILATDPSVKSTSIVDLDVDVDTGDLYLADFGVNRVRRVTYSNRFISLVAGNGSTSVLGEFLPPTSSGMIGPSGVLFHRIYNRATGKSEPVLFVSGGTGSHNIRQANFDSNLAFSCAGKVSTNGGYADGAALDTAMFRLPLGMGIYSHPPTSTTDKEGSAYTLFVADSGNNAIRAVVPNRMVTTIAGTGKNGGRAGDGGPSVFAMVQGPTDIEVDQARNLVLVAEADNNIVRMIDAGGIISTVAGAGTTAGTASNLVNGNGSRAILSPIKPLRLSLDADRSLLFFTDSGSKTVRCIACLREGLVKPGGAGNPAGKMFDLALGELAPCRAGYYCPEGNTVVFAFGAFLLAPPACPAGAICESGSSAPSFPSPTPSPSLSASVSASSSVSASQTPSSTPSLSPLSPSGTPTRSRTISRSVSISFSATASKSSGASISASSTETASKSAEPTTSTTIGVTASRTGSISFTPTRTITRTASASLPEGVSPTSSKTPKRSASATAAASSSGTASPLALNIFASASSTPSASSTYLPPEPASLEANIFVPGLSLDAIRQPSVVQILLDFLACTAAASANKGAADLGATPSSLVVAPIRVNVTLPGGGFNSTSSALCPDNPAGGSTTGGGSSSLRNLRTGRSLQQQGVSLLTLFLIFPRPPSTSLAGAGGNADVRETAAMSLFDSLKSIAGGDSGAGGDQSIADAFAIAVNRLVNDPFLQLDGNSDLSLLQLSGLTVASLSAPLIPALPTRTTGGNPPPAASLPPAPQPNGGSGGEGGNGAAIAGGVVGGLVVLAGLSIGAMYLLTGRFPWSPASGAANAAAKVSGARATAASAVVLAGAGVSKKKSRRSTAAGRRLSAAPPPEAVGEQEFDPSFVVANPALSPASGIIAARKASRGKNVRPPPVPPSRSPADARSANSSVASLREYRSHHLPTTASLAAPRGRQAVASSAVAEAAEAGDANDVSEIEKNEDDVGESRGQQDFASVPTSQPADLPGASSSSSSDSTAVRDDEDPAPLRSAVRGGVSRRSLPMPSPATSHHQLQSLRSTYASSQITAATILSSERVRPR